jgi:signal transduction histidine kinase
VDELIATAIHDAKNRLGAVDALLASAEECNAAVGEARQLTRDINRQLVELLAFYREGAGVLRLVVDDHDLVNFCHDVRDEFILPAHSGLVVETDFTAADRLGAWAFDGYQAQLILLDALRNAARFAQRTLRFQLEAMDRGICFVVADDGPGYPPEVLAGANAAMSPGSTGLGLRFARLIAARHTTPDGRCGSVLLSNVDGAEFRLCLP